MGGYIPQAKRGDWRTPPEVLELVRQVFGGRIGLDPCAAPEPEHSFAKGNFAGPTGSPADGLAHEWRGSVYVNPPFGELAAWAEKCALEHRAHGAEVILLLPSRTDTAYWHEHLSAAALLCLWRGRMKFVGAPASCPFPVTLAYFGHRPAVFHAVFAARGMIVAPSAPARRAS